MSIQTHQFLRAKEIFNCPCGYKKIVDDSERDCNTLYCPSCMVSRSYWSAVDAGFVVIKNDEYIHIPFGGGE